MKTKIPEFRISKKLLRLKFVEVKLNHKAYNLISHLCTSNSLCAIIDAAKEPCNDQHHYIHISQRQIAEMRQLIKRLKTSFQER